MKIVALVPFLAAAFGFGAQAAPTTVVRPITVSLASASTTDRRVSESLLLHVWGDSHGFEIELLSNKPLRGCFKNLVHWSLHGPDPSEVLPWQISQSRFPNARSIPVCGKALMVEISLASPILSADGERFVAGTLVVSIRHSNQVSQPAPNNSFKPKPLRGSA